MFQTVLKSRKFWAAVIGVVYSFLAVAAPDFPISEEAAANGVAVLNRLYFGCGVGGWIVKKQIVTRQQCKALSSCWERAPKPKTLAHRERVG